MLQPRYKIAILLEALGNGGAERSAGLLSKIFDDLGHDVYMITITDVVEYPFAGKLINLGLLKNKSNSWLNKLKRFLHLKKLLKTEKIDFIIDFRFRKTYLKEWLIAHYLYADTRLIYMVRSFHLAYYFPNTSAKTTTLFARAFTINSVTERITSEIQTVYNLNNLSTIKNPVDFDEIESLSNKKISVNGRFIVAAGRMSIDVKQFDQLIIAYSKSSLPQQKIALKILGTGKLMENYKQLAIQLNLEDYIHFEGFKENPFPYFKAAEFFVLCSKFEGSPRALLESLACGTPVIAMDCPTGPREIIQNKKNGLLVPKNDFKALKTAMNQFITDDALRQKCAAYAQNSITVYTMENVGKDWQKLLNSAV